MAISRTPLNRPAENDEFEFQTPTAQIFEDVDNERNGGKKEEVVDDKYDAISKQLSDLQTRLSQAEAANMSLLSQPNWRSQVENTFVEVKPESVELPDPALDPNGYEQAMARRLQIRDDNKTRKAEFENRRQQQASEKVDDLWEAFNESYSEYTEDKEKIDFIATKLVKKAQRRGIDVERYMFGTRDKFMADVAKEYDNVFGEPEGENEEDTRNTRRTSSRDDTRTPARNRRRDREENDVSRTGGIFGGNESGGRASGRRSDVDDGPTMIDDIQGIQKKTGFF